MNFIKMVKIYRIILFIILIGFSKSTISYAYNLDSYLRGYFGKHGINLQIYNSEDLEKIEYKNVVTSDKYNYDYFLSKNFDNLIFFCSDYQTINECYFDLVKNEFLNLNEIDININGPEELIIFNLTSNGRNIYLIPKEFIYSVNYSTNLVNYFDVLFNEARIDIEPSYDTNYDFVIRLFIYTISLFTLYFFIYILINFRKIKKVIYQLQENFKIFSLLSIIIFVISLIFHPLILYIYKIINNKSLGLELFKSFYIIDILKPKLSSIFNLIFYFIHITNLFIISLSIFIISLNLLIKFFNNYDVGKKNINFIITLVILFILIPNVIQTNSIISTQNTLFNNNKIIFNKKYTIDKSTKLKNIYLKSNDPVFINNYLINHPKYTTINNYNLSEFSNNDSNYQIVSSNLKDTIKTMFYLNNNNKLMSNNLTSLNSNIKFFKNLSYNTSDTFYALVNLNCLYDTNSFTFSLYIYNPDQIESELEPDKIDFYNFPGCSKGQNIKVKLPIREFNSFENDTIIVLRSREQEANKNINTNGIKYWFELYQGDIKLPSININKEKGILYSQIKSESSNIINNYSINIKNYSINDHFNNNFIITDILKDLLDRNLIKNSFTISTELN